MASSDYKKFNREVKGYVLMNSNVKDRTICTSISLLDNNTAIQPITNGNQFTVGNIINASLKKHNWAILRNSYTLLDGSYNLFNTTWKPYGFISNKKVSELTSDAEIILDFSSTVDSITLCFQENPLKNAEVRVYNNGTETRLSDITNNTSDLVYIDLSDYTFTEIIIKVTEWNNADLPIWIKSIVLGYAYIYEDNELIDFTVTEEVNKLVEDTPSNELVLTIGDYDKKYDPLNPSGITSLLSEENTTFEPYIGIVAEDGSTEYTNMGTFYFNKIDYNNKEVTITAYNLLEKIKKLPLRNVNRSLLSTSIFISANTLTQRLTTWFSNSYDFDYHVDIDNELILGIAYFKENSLLGMLQCMANFDGILYVNRNNLLCVENIDTEIKDSIKKEQLLNDLKYINVFNSKSYYLERESTYSDSTSEANTENDFETSFIMSSDIEYVTITSNDPQRLFGIKTSDLTYTGATNVEVLGNSNQLEEENSMLYLLFLKVTGTTGTSVTISGKKPYKYDGGVRGTSKKLKGSNIESDITINNPLQFVTPASTKFIDKMYSYKVDLDYNGNPTIKAGDYIQVESNYGMVPIFVQKHTLKYNGGLSGSIEGVE